MKFWLSLLLALPLVLLAQDDLNYPLFELETEAPPPFYPFSISGQYVNVSKADFRTSEVADSNLRYIQSDIAFAYTYPYNLISGLIFGAGWVGTTVDMKDNPQFDETEFNYINLSIGAFTKAVPDWTWTVTVAAFFDTEQFSLVDYTLYQGVLWGKYSLCSFVEIDLGLILEVGLKKDKVWPIFGFIYLPSENWRINMVYPINVAVEYDWTSCLTLAGSIRFLRNRHRVGCDQPNPQAIFEYETAGAEFDLVYKPARWALLKAFVGHTFDGDFKVSNRNDKDTIHYKFEGSSYAGISGVLSF